MNFHGGGYSDIKEINESWLNQYNKLKNSEDLWGYGCRERSEEDIAYGNDESFNKKMKENYNNLIATNQFIFKSNTPLTNEWYKQLVEKMDIIYEDLKKYPSKEIRQVYTKEYPYPLEWTELLGKIYHPIVYKYNNKILKGLPRNSLNNYR